MYRDWCVCLCVVHCRVEIHCWQCTGRPTAGLCLECCHFPTSLLHPRHVSTPTPQVRVCVHGAVSQSGASPGPPCCGGQYGVVCGFGCAPSPEKRIFPFQVACFGAFWASLPWCNSLQFLCVHTSCLTYPATPRRPSKLSDRICISLRNTVWQKLDGHVTPLATPLQSVMNF